MTDFGRHGYRLNTISLLLAPLALLFCALAWLRSRLYRAGVLVSVRLPVPVIIVGNITVGGTGKTPLVLWLADQLQAAGYRPGIITRGYRGASRTWPLVVLPDTPASVAGDEPVLLARRSSCPVVAGPDRVADARELIARRCDVIVSDDGLQHYRLARTLEIAVIDGARRFGNGLCLPAGPLREPKSRLQSVTFRVTNGPARAGEVPMQLPPQYLYRLDAPDQRLPVAALNGEPVHAVAGIGNPERFFATLRSLGMPVIAHAFPDHHDFAAGDLDFGDSLPVIMTEKDAVKCRAFAQPHYWVLVVSAQLPEGFAAQVLQRLEEARRG